MTKKEMKSVLARLRNLIDINSNRELYLCTLVYKLDLGWIKTKETHNFLWKNIPNEHIFSIFTKTKYWRGFDSWWYLSNARDDGNLREVYMAKRRYLNKLIKSI